MIRLLIAAVLGIMGVALALAGPAANSAAQPAVGETPTPTATTIPGYVPGRNDRTIVVDGITREYVVFIPNGYTGSVSTPLVVHFHGGGGSGPSAFGTSRWPQVAQANNFIAVFPSGLVYCTNEGTESRWNSVGLSTPVLCPGEVLADDVKFVRDMVSALRASLNIDSNRTFGSGFSNGGGLVMTRLMAETPDLFASFAAAGIVMQESHQPVGNDVRSLYNLLGTRDPKMLDHAGVPGPFPMNPAAIASDPFLGTAHTGATETLDLSSSYQAALEPPCYTIMTYNQSLIGRDNEFVFRMVNNLVHVFPDGVNNACGLVGAQLFWDFFLTHPRSPSPATPTPTFTSIGTPTVTSTPTFTSIGTPTVTSTPTATGCAWGGHNFTLNATVALVPGVVLSWLPGTCQTGYVAWRLSIATGQVVQLPGSPLPASATTLSDPAPPAGGACYALQVLNGGFFTDVLCVLEVAGASQDLAVGLNQSLSGQLSWTAASGATGYLRNQVLPISASLPLPTSPTSSNFPAVSNALNCFSLVANLSGSSPYSDLVCAWPMPGFGNVP